MLSQIDEIKSRLNIVDVIQNYVRLQKAGTNFKAPCPFHNEKTPSFMVSPARQIWHCFGCQKGGDAFRFIMEIDGVEFPEALKMLAQKAGVALKKEDPKLKSERTKLCEISETSAKFFEENLQKSDAGKKAKEYLILRGLKPEIIKEWRIGYALNNWDALNKHLTEIGYKLEDAEKAGLIIKGKEKHYDRFRGRIMFPIFDLNGKIIGFGGRIFEEPNREEGKYVNSPQTLIYDKSKVLYGLDKSKVEIRKKDSAIVVEGYMDLIMSYQSGVKNVVAASGTALTQNHLLILKRYTNNLLTAFDMDTAGETATKRSLDLARNQGFNIKVITLGSPANKEKIDPADLVKKSPEIWLKSAENALEITQFYFENALAKFDAKTAEGKAKIAQNFLPELKKITNKIIQAHWISELARKISVKEEDVREELKKIPLAGFDVASRASGPTVAGLPAGGKKDKNREDLVFERMIGLLLRYPEKKFLVETNRDFFEKNHKPRIETIEKIFQNDKSYFESNFPHLMIERENDSEEDPEFEINTCVKDLKAYALRRLLDDISKEIIQAETAGDEEKLTVLSRQFNDCSNKLLEIN